MAHKLLAHNVSQEPYDALREDDDEQAYDDDDDALLVGILLSILQSHSLMQSTMLLVR
jgi:hypothetical protein